MCSERQAAGSASDLCEVMLLTSMANEGPACGGVGSNVPTFLPLQPMDEALTSVQPTRVPQRLATYRVLFKPAVGIAVQAVSG
jgi:hypothetical protein